MADLSDLENALSDQLEVIIYPNGLTSQAIVDTTFRIYRGWPTPSALNSDLTAGYVNVSIFSSAIPTELLEPYLDTSSSAPVDTKLTAVVSGQSVTFSGAVGQNLNVGILLDAASYVYRPVASDTSLNVAAGLASLIKNDRPVLASGATITIPGASRIVPRIGGLGSVTKVLRRQRAEIQIITWCPAPNIRDTVASYIDAAIAANSFISLADGTFAHVRYHSTKVYDQSQNALLYRRDLTYICDYMMIYSESQPVMLFGDLKQNNSISTV